MFDAFDAQVSASWASLAATGALVLELGAEERAAVQTLLEHQDTFFTATPAAEKQRHAAAGDACGSTGYRALRGKELYDYRPHAALFESSTMVPSAFAETAPPAYAALSAAGRDLLAALSTHPAARGATEAPVDLAALCEPSPRDEEAVTGSSVLSLFRYEAAAGGAAPHVDRGLLTLVACADAGLQLREHAASGDRDAAARHGGDDDGDEKAEEARWAPLPQLRLGEVAVLVGATLAAATGNSLRAATHRVVPQPTPRLATVMRLRGATQALLPRATVGAFEAQFASSRVSVNRNLQLHHRADERGGRGRGTKRRASDTPLLRPVLTGPYDHAMCD